METFINWVTSKAMIESFATIIVAIALLAILRKFYYSNAKLWHQQEGTSNRRKKRATALYTALRYVILGLSALTILQVNGVDVRGVLAGLGIVSVVLGLALQDTAQDLIMGIRIATDHYFEIGDFIRYGTYEGEVIQITPQSTKVRDGDGNITTISNRNITEATIVSKTFNVEAPLPYDLSSEEAESFLLAVSALVEEIPGIEACEYKGVQLFDANTINYCLRITGDPKTRKVQQRGIRTILQKEMEKAGISFPYNIVDVHIAQQ